MTQTWDDVDSTISISLLPLLLTEWKCYNRQEMRKRKMEKLGKNHREFSHITFACFILQKWKNILNRVIQETVLPYFCVCVLYLCIDPTRIYLQRIMSIAVTIVFRCFSSISLSSYNKNPNGSTKPLEYDFYGMT